MRTALVIAGLTIVFIASLFLLAKPPAHLVFTLPSIPSVYNVPYLLYLRGLQHLLGQRLGVVMVANAGLIWLTLIGVYRAGWGWADPRYRLLGATLAMILVLFHPLAMILPLTVGFLGGNLMVPLFLILFINVMIGIDHWSAFMRAILLSVSWSLFLWVHLPTAVYILVAMAVWVLYSRRPQTSLGIFVAVFLLGTLLFSGLWTLGCIAMRRWSMISEPFGTARLLVGYFYQGLSTSWAEGLRAIPERLVHVSAWLSPFLMILGVWSTATSIRQMVRDRRANTADFTALIAIIILGVTLITPGKDLLPGAWYLFAVGVLWVPLVSRRVAQKENFYSRGFRLTFLAGFVICAVVFIILLRGVPDGAWVPGGYTLLKLTTCMTLAGGALHGMLKKHPLTIENRLNAYLTGSTLAYFLVVDSLLFR